MSTLAAVSNSKQLHCIQAYTSGSGTPLVLLPGWPETADAYAEIFSSLAANYQVWALDPPGLGQSSPSASGYDTAAISSLLSEAISEVVTEPYHLVGHDVGGWIAYAWAAQYPQAVRSLTILDCAIPGAFPRLMYPLAHKANINLWQFSFNRLPDLPEILTKGKERELFDWLFDVKTQHPERITETKRNFYVEAYSRPGRMRLGFEYYRAFDRSAEQNKAFAETKLKMPVLALGGQSAVGGGVKACLEGVAEDVTGGVVEDCGHYLMEEQPAFVAERLVEFFRGVDAQK